MIFNYKKKAQNIRPPRGKIRTLYKEKDLFPEYSLVFGTDTKRFYMKLGDELMAFTPPIEELNNKSEIACKHCNTMIPSTSLEGKSSIIECPNCGFIFDSFIVDTHRPESNICLYDLVDYVNTELSKIAENTEKVSINILQDNSTQIANSECLDFSLSKEVKNPLIYIYPSKNMTSNIEDPENSYVGYSVKVLGDVDKIKLIVVLNMPSKRARKPENKKIKIEDVYVNLIYEESDTPEGLFKDAIEDFKKYLNHLKEEYKITD